MLLLYLFARVFARRLIDLATGLREFYRSDSGLVSSSVASSFS
ncbi:hypothetical protein ACFFX0_25965 [Citricoccus parietis]|uniref:Uncharacterized protein n=1 Tax=Citricoccus parietis TaxID=592307 RepID=A0ABV5G675_9MICC